LSLSSNCFERLALDNGQLEFIFSNCFERLALDNGQLEFIFSNCFERLALDNGQLEFIFSNCFEQLALDNGQLEFIFSNCFERLALDNGQLEFIFSNYFERLVLNNGQLEFTFHFLKSVIPCFIRKRDVTQFFAFNIKFHSPLCRNTEYQISFPALSEHGIPKLSFPVLAEDGVSTISSPDMSDDETSLNFLFKCLSPLCRMTKCQKCHPQCVWSRDVTNQMSVSTNHQFTNTFQNFPLSIQDFVFLSSYCYQHGSGQSFSLVKLQYPLMESGPFLQRIWVSFCSSSFKTNHLCHPTFIITSRAFITS